MSSYPWLKDQDHVLPASNKSVDYTEGFYCIVNTNVVERRSEVGIIVDFKFRNNTPPPLEVVAVQSANDVLVSGISYHALVRGKTH